MRLDELYQMVIARFSENAPKTFADARQKVQKKRADFQTLFTPVHIGGRG